jgi:hypothetical protein
VGPLSETDAPWAAGICHPLPLGAALVMAINDHWLKGSGLFPGAVTGKVSDAAGLFFAPALIVAVCLGLFAIFKRRPPFARHLPLVACAAVGLGFAAAILAAPFNALLAEVWLMKRMDPTDLWTLPALAGAWVWMRRRYEG